MKTNTSYMNPTDSKVMNLPILKHFGDGTLTTTDPLKSFRKGEKGMFNVLKLALLVGIGYLSWVYVLPPLFLALGKIIAGAGAVILVIALFMMAPVILKSLRRITRWFHKLVIKHDPFGELEEQKMKMQLNKKKFTKAKAKIIKLKSDMQLEASESEKEAKKLQKRIVSSRNKIKTLKERQKELHDSGKSSDGEYISNHAELLKLSASVQREMSQEEQQKNFVSKYGTRAATMDKLNQKLIIVGAQMDIKILDFDATIDILKKDYEFAQKSREATKTAKDAMMFTEGWEVEYALDIVTTTIAEDIAATAANLTDIDSITTLYDLDSDELYMKLDEVADSIVTGENVVPSAKDYSNPNYKPTHEDMLNDGGFGQLFNK